MTVRINSQCSVGNRWGIASVNKAVTNDMNRIFNFKFIINDNETVTYDASFDFSRTQYQDRYSSSLNAIEQNSFVRISDMKRIVRDYPNLTNFQINNIFQRLTNTCLECIKHDLINIEKYVLCVNLDGSRPFQLSLPPFPFIPAPPKPKRPNDNAMVMEDIDTGDVMVVEASKNRPCPPIPPCPPKPKSEPSFIPFSDSGMCMQDLETGQVMSRD